MNNLWTGIWTFLQDETNREILTLLGGALVIVVGGAWAVFTFSQTSRLDSQTTELIFKLTQYLEKRTETRIFWTARPDYRNSTVLPSPAHDKSTNLDAHDYKLDSTTEYIISLIKAGDADGIILATYVKRIEKSGHLLGSHIGTTSDHRINLWLISGRSHHVIYAYYPEKRRIQYLIAFEGELEPNLEIANERLRLILS